MVTSISSNSDSIQVVYDNYLACRYIVNRRYQRKLVWTQQEKEYFIDSIINNYSVPLFLLAQNNDEKGFVKYEIIDGMQRLNSIVSFIENEFPVGYKGENMFFDLDTLASTLDQKRSGKLKQRKPVLPKDVCMEIVKYQVPFSFIIADKQSIEEIFRRINSFGRQLSGQEIRQAGAVGVFPDMVRKIASTIRGDVSTSDILPLNKMKFISLSNVRLKYGINVNDIWWVRQHIITEANIRVSRDEELIAWLLSYIVLGKGISPSSRALTKLYRYDYVDKDGRNLAEQVEAKIKELGEKNIIEMFCKTFSFLLEILHDAKKDFRTLIFTRDEAEGLVRTFQVIFLAFYELMFKEKMSASDMIGLIKHLDGIGMNVLRGIATDNWTAETRYDKIQAVKGVIRPYFHQSTGEDVASDNWVIQVENIMRLSTIEGPQYDFKIGIHNLNDSKLNRDLVSKCVKLLTAAVNKGPNTKGYVIIGICDGKTSYETYKNFYHTNHGTQYQNTSFYVTGIDDEVKRFYGGSYDKYQR